MRAKRPISGAVSCFSAVQTVFAKKIGVELMTLSVDFSLTKMNPVGVAADNGAEIWRIAGVMFEFTKTKHKRRCMAGKLEILYHSAPRQDACGQSAIPYVDGENVLIVAGDTNIADHFTRLW